VTAVKICGIRRVDDALVAAEAGADMLGLVFAPSRRRIDPDAARDIVTEVKRQAKVKAVGVFVNESVHEMNRIARHCKLDLVQLSGDEPGDTAAALDLPAIQVLHVGRGETAVALERRAARSDAQVLLLDTARPGTHGGTGETFGWETAQELCAQRSVLLAGGLRPDNVVEAIRTAHPWGVDVSSGVERDGWKDAGLIREFVRAAKGTDATVPAPRRCSGIVEQTISESA